MLSMPDSFPSMTHSIAPALATVTNGCTPPSDQAGGGGRWRRGQERHHHPVLPEAVRDGLRPYYRGLLHPAHGGGRTMVHPRW